MTDKIEKWLNSHEHRSDPVHNSITLLSSDAANFSFVLLITRADEHVVEKVQLFQIQVVCTDQWLPIFVSSDAVELGNAVEMLNVLIESSGSFSGADGARWTLEHFLNSVWMSAFGEEPRIKLDDTGDTDGGVRTSSASAAQSAPTLRADSGRSQGSSHGSSRGASDSLHSSHHRPHHHHHHRRSQHSSSTTSSSRSRPADSSRSRHFEAHSLPSSVSRPPSGVSSGAQRRRGVFHCPLCFAPNFTEEELVVHHDRHHRKQTQMRAVHCPICRLDAVSDALFDQFGLHLAAAHMSGGRSADPGVPASDFLSTHDTVRTTVAAYLDRLNVRSLKFYVSETTKQVLIFSEADRSVVIGVTFDNSWQPVVVSAESVKHEQFEEMQSDVNMLIAANRRQGRRTMVTDLLDRMEEPLRRVLPVERPRPSPSSTSSSSSSSAATSAVASGVSGAGNVSWDIDVLPKVRAAMIDDGVPLLAIDETVARIASLVSSNQIADALRIIEIEVFARRPMPRSLRQKLRQLTANASVTGRPTSSSTRASSLTPTFAPSATLPGAFQSNLATTTSFFSGLSLQKAEGVDLVRRELRSVCDRRTESSRKGYKVRPCVTGTLHSDSASMQWDVFYDEFGGDNASAASKRIDLMLRAYAAMQRHLCSNRYVRQSLYAHAQFQVQVRFPPDYPARPPSFRVVSPPLAPPGATETSTTTTTSTATTSAAPSSSPSAPSELTASIMFEQQLQFGDEWTEASDARSAIEGFRSRLADDATLEFQWPANVDVALLLEAVDQLSGPALQARLDELLRGVTMAEPLTTVANFWEFYLCLSAEEHMDHFEGGGKVLLPGSALGAQTTIGYDGGGDDASSPMMFEISVTGSRRTFCGVLEFTAPEGCCVVPHWMQSNIGCRQGDTVEVRRVRLPSAKFVRLRPHRDAFFDLGNGDSKALLEWVLPQYPAMCVGDTISIEHGGEIYCLDVVEARPARQVSLIDTDVELEFAEALDANSKERKEERAKAAAAKSPVSAANVVGAAGGGAAAEEASAVSTEQPRTRPDKLQSNEINLNNARLYASDSVDFDSATPVESGTSSVSKKSPSSAVTSPGHRLVSSVDEEDDDDAEYSRCDTCHHRVPKANFAMHEMQCARRNYWCERCQECLLKSKREEHERERHTDVACELGCGAHMTPSVLKTHLSDECPLRIVKCPYYERCAHQCASRDLDAHRRQCAEEAPVRCAYFERCAVALPRAQIAAHERSCKEEEPVRCAYFDYCGLSLPRKALAAHESACGDKTLECERCGQRCARKHYVSHISSSCRSRQGGAHFEYSSVGAGNSVYAGMEGGGVPIQDFQCGYCAERFSLPDDLQVHVITTHQDQVHF